MTTDPLEQTLAKLNSIVGGDFNADKCLWAEAKGLFLSEPCRAYRLRFVNGHDPGTPRYACFTEVLNSFREVDLVLRDEDSFYIAINRHKQMLELMHAQAD